jgi:hypothetical protein
MEWSFLQLFKSGIFLLDFFVKKTTFSTNELSTPLQALQELEQTTQEME